MAAKIPALRDPAAVPHVATELAEMFGRTGRSLYLVGGSVRGLVQGKLSGDLDFATDATPEEVLEIVRDWHEGTWTVGIEFGTVGLMKDGHRFEITTFRGDRYDPSSRHPEVTSVSTIEDDLARRDFTINAMAVRLPDRTFVDPFEGQADLERGVLRTPMSPEESLSDDPLRMLRAARFVAQLGVTPADDLVDAMRAQRERLKIISAERIRDELLKIIAAEHPAAGLDLAVEAGLGDEFLPELPALRLEQDPIHRHKDVYRHSLAVMENLMDAKIDGEPDVDLRLAGLLHDIGKPATRRFGPDGVSFHHHEVVGARMAEHRLRELHFPTDTIKDIATLIELHLRFHEYRPDWRDMVVQVLREQALPEEAIREIGRIVSRAELEYRSAGALIDDVASRLAKAGIDPTLIASVRDAMAMRQKIFGTKPGWKDSAVRRYVRDAGPLLGRLNALVLADCTTRNVAKAKRLQLAMAIFESRIARLAEEENIKQMRPALNGDEVMAHLGIPPSRRVGEALKFLLEVRLDQGEISKDEAKKLLDEWARAEDVKA
ncbi:MAG TPA: CCA tRNA nucleotidyltransferase [Actinomycetota bacterium]|nr:CCA tRNA nucleotidyltransferase [Actinomycetota bacterium]